MKVAGYLGFALRGMIYDIIRRRRPLLSHTLHEAKRIAPFSVSPYLSYPDLKIVFRSIKAGSVGIIRVAALSEEFSRIMVDEVVANSELELRLHGVRLETLELMVEEFRYSRLMEQAQPITSFKVNFLTPTFFRRSLKPDCCHGCPINRKTCPLIHGAQRRKMRYICYPDPYLMFRSLARLWRAFSPIKFNYAKYVDWLRKGGIVVSGIPKLKTVKVYEHPTTPKWSVGFIGTVHFNLPEDTYDEEMAKITHALLNFAKYSNVGGNRTAAFGTIDFTVKNTTETPNTPT